jgi:hypothetical protein
MWSIPYVGMFLSLLVAPLLTFGFVIIIRKQKNDVEKLRLRKEMMELEVRKEELRIKSIQEEGKQYDKLIDSR